MTSYQFVLLFRLKYIGAFSVANMEALREMVMVTGGFDHP